MEYIRLLDQAVDNHKGYYVTDMFPIISNIALEIICGKWMLWMGTNLSNTKKFRFNSHLSTEKLYI